MRRGCRESDDPPHIVLARAYRKFLQRYLVRLFRLLEMIEQWLATLVPEQEQAKPDPIKQGYRQVWLEYSERLLPLLKKIESHLAAMAAHKEPADGK